MNRLPFSIMKSRWLSYPAIIVAASIMGGRSVEAGLTLESSSGSTTFAVYNTTPGSGSGTFNTNTGSPGYGNSPYGTLIYPGGALPSLTTQTGSSQTVNASTLSPYFLSSSNANSVPSNFGSATTEVYVANSGQEGSFTTQGGVYWSLKTKVADNLPAGSSLASVSYSTAVATYYNGTSGSITINPGAILSVTGSLGSSTGYVAAGLATSITLFDGEDTTTTALDPIILAASGSGVNIASKGGSNANEFASVTVNGSTVSGTGTSLAASPITLFQGETITVTSYLTLISDPGSSIGLSDNLPDGLTYAPDFGAFASSPSVVPEPATIALLGSGLLMAGIWGRHRSARKA